LNFLFHSQQNLPLSGSHVIAYNTRGFVSTVTIAFASELTEKSKRFHKKTGRHMRMEQKKRPRKPINWLEVFWL